MFKIKGVFFLGKGFLIKKIFEIFNIESESLCCIEMWYMEVFKSCKCGVNLLWLLENILVDYCSFCEKIKFYCYFVFRIWDI